MRQMLAVIRKDMRIEWHGMARSLTLVAFAGTVLLLFSFAVGSDSQALARHAGAYLWLTVLLASTLQLERSFQTEVESGALESLLLLPTSPVALYYGKALSNWAQLLALAILSLPVVVVLYDANTSIPLHWLGVSLILGTASLAAPGTLYAAMVARVRGGQILLPLLLFPLVVPAVLASVKSSALILSGDPMNQLPGWTGLLLCFNLIYWSLGGIIFSKVSAQ